MQRCPCFGTSDYFHYSLFVLHLRWDFSLVRNRQSHRMRNTPEEVRHIFTLRKTWSGREEKDSNFTNTNKWKHQNGPDFVKNIIALIDFILILNSNSSNISGMLSSMPLRNLTLQWNIQSALCPASLTASSSSSSAKLPLTNGITCSSHIHSYFGLW